MIQGEHAVFILHFGSLCFKRTLKKMSLLNTLYLMTSNCDKCPLKHFSNKFQKREDF